MSLMVKVAHTKKDIRTFMDYPNKLYKNHPYYIPPLLSDEVKSAFLKTNISLEFCEVIHLMAFQDNVMVGRIRGIINHPYNEKNNVRHLRFNHFDVIDDFEVTKALFDYLIKWGLSKGMDTINGPIGFNDLEKQGLLIDGFDLEGMFITYYNHPYYVTHLEKMGLLKDVDWVEYRVNLPNEINPRILKVAERIKRKESVSIKSFKSKKALKPYLYKIFDTYNQAFAPLHGTVTLNERQIDHYVKQYLPIMNLDYLSVLVDKNDDVIAFGLLGPNINQAMKKNRGRLFPFGFIPLLNAIKHSKILDMYLVAVRPDKQGQGLNALLMLEITKRAIQNKILYAETGPELEDNLKVQSFWKNYEATLVRRRRCYIKPLKKES